ncbi:hypothetical protein KIW84_058418 [Lathyrus oleraceus]|uniref:YTH domain-containing family protein n=1 Tax=Pisum sativum TaxID=3888 RepID=A0A9D4X5U5_PEA|nr:hypothetical protein KIW84_058418 [Pisum sativum]
MKRKGRLLIFQTVSNTTRLIFQKNTQEAQQKPGGCPICLLFSVNTSGQFVGLAEMIGPVDFNKSLEYWQQDKWNGCFPLKWHIVKDVPNNVLRHIILLNNENKPVTNSRDTQEVLLDLAAADLDNDGSISKSDFVIYKLKQMGKITEIDILQISKQFDSLDHGICGKITLADLMETV